MTAAARQQTARRTAYLPVTPAQNEFLYRPEPFVAFIGGIGSGKSFILCYDALMFAYESRKPVLLMLAAPTYPMLRDATLRSFVEVAGMLGIPFAYGRSENVARVLRTGSEILFRSADDPDRMRGPNLSRVGLDEASVMARAAFDVAIGRLRQGGEVGKLRAGFTPKGKAHWTYEVFGTGRPGTHLVHARTADNPFLAEQFEATVRGQYTSAQARQELGGEFTDPEGCLFRRDWFPVVEQAPPCVRRVRWWDLAATAPKAGTDPDYTAGVLMGKTRDGRYVVLDVRRLRGTPRAVEQLVKATATQDGRGVEVWMEQEPGSSGVAVVDSYARLLAGYVFRGLRSTGDKADRARPLAAAAESGLVSLVRGPFVKDTLDELETFPQGAHDDVVDGMSAAFLRLASAVPQGAPSAGGRAVPRGPEDGPGAFA